MVAVERVTAPRIVLVILPVLLDEMIIDLVAKALEVERGPEVVAFVGEVEDHVHYDGNVSLMQGLHHVAEIMKVFALLRVKAVALLGRKKTDCAVAPVVAQGGGAVRRRS